MTNTIIYSIPTSFFPGVKVIQPFHAKVKYEYAKGKVTIADVCLSSQCLKYINVSGLVDRIEQDIAEAERKKANNPMHPVFQEVLAPFINH